MIRLKNINFHYGESIKEQTYHLKDINLDIKKGEFILLCGKSGCGKTSLLRLMNGLIPHYYEGKLSGDIYIDNNAIINRPIYDISKHVSTVFQNPKSQFFNIDTTSEILFSLENRGYSKSDMKEKLKEVATLFNIESLLDRSIFELSGGEKQKIAIASAFVNDTDIIILDEPTSNLDFNSIEAVKKMLTLLKERGKTIVISEHRLYFLIDLMDRAIYIDEGRIKREFNRETFMNMPTSTRIELGLREIHLDKVRCFENKAPNYPRSLHVEHLSYRYKNTKSDALNIKKQKFSYGTIIGIIGKNGQGKSTFANCLIGLCKKAKATIYIDGNKQSHKARLKSSYLVMQDVTHQLFTESVEEELKLGANKQLKAVDIESILTKMNILTFKDNHPVGLSGGQKQRVSIGAGICSGAEIMFFDEPTSGMDYYHMLETSKLLKEIASENNILFVISHDLEFLSHVANSIVEVKGGQIQNYYAIDTQSIQKMIHFLK